MSYPQACGKQQSLYQKQSLWVAQLHPALNFQISRLLIQTQKRRSCLSLLPPKWPDTSYPLGIRPYPCHRWRALSPCSKVQLRISVILSTFDRYGFNPQFLVSITITVVLILTYRLGIQIQIPFINTEAFQEIFKTYKNISILIIMEGFPYFPWA